MKRIAVYFDEDTRDDLLELARRRGRTISELVRCAVVNRYEDELDAIACDKAIEEHQRDPGSSISWEELKHQVRQGIQKRDT